MSERITFSLLRLKRGSTVLSEQQVAAVLSILCGQDTVVCLQNRTWQVRDLRSRSVVPRNA